MAGNTTKLALQAADTEKVTINLGYLDLGRIDLLVQEGFYSNRSDFIRAAIRAQLGAHHDVIQQTAARKTFVLGLQDVTRAQLEAAQAKGERLQIQVLGMARIAEDVSVELALATIESVRVLGGFQAPPAVQKALADRIR
jgi:Arc/MetJ-type ribon-helix-helix transcriptional regulator